jgi:hypothetical protein
MRKQFKEDSETAHLITTQFVFAEVPPRGEEIELFKKVYNVQINDAKDLPSSFIVSAKGELITRLPGMVPADKLREVLKEGIEKTGGFKGAEGAKRRLEAALKEVDSAKEQLESEDSLLDGLMTLIRLERQHSRIAEVKKSIRTILGKVATSADQKAVLQQARMLDVAQLHVDNKRKTQAIAQYQAVAKKFPDTPAATIAEEKLGELNGAAATKDAEEKPAEETADSEEEAEKEEKAAKEETSDESEE